MCRRVVELARFRRSRIVGLLTESSRLPSGQLVQTAVSLRTGERRRLAEHVGCDDPRPADERRGMASDCLSWRFLEDSLRWGRHELRRFAGREVDLLVVDQLGPLELTFGSGWTNALDTVTDTPATLTLVVVNPLVIADLRSWPGFGDGVVIEVNQATREILPDCLAHAAGWGVLPGRNGAGAIRPRTGRAPRDARRSRRR